MLAEPRCSLRNCKHLTGAYQSDDTEMTEVPACVAFPKGIPAEVAYGNNPHTKPYPGDHGIQYEKQIAKYSPDQPRVPAGSPGGGQFGSDGGGSASDLAFEQATAAEFIAQRDSSRPSILAGRERTSRAGYLSPVAPSDLKDHQLFLTADGRVGVAVDKDGDVQNVFNNKGPKGSGADALVHAIDHGGRTLDCYDGFLPQFYGQFGFVESARMKFNPDYANPAWDHARDDSPDVVFMKWAGYPPGGKNVSLARAKGDKTAYMKIEATPTTVGDFDEGKRLSRENPAG